MTWKSFRKLEAIRGTLAMSSYWMMEVECRSREMERRAFEGPRRHEQVGSVLRTMELWWKATRLIGSRFLIKTLHQCFCLQRIRWNFCDFLSVQAQLINQRENCICVRKRSERINGSKESEPFHASSSFHFPGKRSKAEDEGLMEHELLFKTARLRWLTKAGGAFFVINYPNWCLFTLHFSINVRERDFFLKRGKLSSLSKRSGIIPFALLSVSSSQRLAGWTNARDGITRFEFEFFSTVIRGRENFRQASNEIFFTFVPPLAEEP